MINTSTIAVLLGETAPDIATTPSRVIKPMAENERPKQYKQSTPIVPQEIFEQRIAGPSIKQLIADGILTQPEQPEIEFTNLDVQRAFDLTESEAFNLTQALVERGFLQRDLMQDAEGRFFYLLSTRRHHDAHNANSINS